MGGALIPKRVAVDKKTTILMCVPVWRETPRSEKNLLLGHLKSLLRKSRSYRQYVSVLQPFLPRTPACNEKIT